MSDFLGAVTFHIGEKCFAIESEPERDHLTSEYLDTWRAWCFFAYDEKLEIYPADAVPDGIVSQESLVGESGSTKQDAVQRVVNTLEAVIRNRNLDGTGFYSPPAGRIWPHEFGKDE